MFVVCGEALYDFYEAERPEGLAFDARIGGSPFNVAMGLARLDVPAALFTCLSTDRLGQRLHGALVTEGVSTACLRRSPRLTALSLVALDDAGSPAYTFYGEGTADRNIGPEDLPDFGADVWGLHVGSFSLVTEPVGSSLLSLVAREAGRRLITLDPNIRLNVEPERAVWRTRLNAVIAQTDLMKVSVEDVALLYPGTDPSEVVARWSKAGPAIVVVTHGDEGATAHGPFGTVAVPARKVTIVDTVGAGDSFMAALIAGLDAQAVRGRQALARLDRTAVKAMLDFAVRAAAVTCSRRGADLPRRSELSEAAAVSV